jgi:hypothetical protein
MADIGWALQYGILHGYYDTGYPFYEACGKDKHVLSRLGFPSTALCVVPLTRSFRPRRHRCIQIDQLRTATNTLRIGAVANRKTSALFRIFSFPRYPHVSPCSPSHGSRPRRPSLEGDRMLHFRPSRFLMQLVYKTGLLGIKRHVSLQRAWIAFLPSASS